MERFHDRPFKDFVAHETHRLILLQLGMSLRTGCAHWAIPFAQGPRDRRRANLQRFNPFESMGAARNRYVTVAVDLYHAPDLDGSARESRHCRSWACACSHRTDRRARLPKPNRGRLGQCPGLRAR
jgi:hypothetical protein